MSKPVRSFGNIIWTNHALDRLEQRGLSQDLAWQAYKYPDKSFAGKEQGTTEFQKRVGASLITLIAKPNEKGEWLVLSNWIDPPLPGTVDYYKKEDYQKYKKAGFWGKMFLTLKKQIGL